MDFNMTTRYAEAWEWAQFFCAASVLTGKHAGGDGDTSLLDDGAQFQKAGFVPNVGQVVYNLTDNSQGTITAVTYNTLTAPLIGGAENMWDTGDDYRAVALTTQQRSTIEGYLNFTSTKVTSALATSNQLSCPKSDDAQAFLGQIAVFLAGAFYNCTCIGVDLSDEVRASYNEFASGELEKLRKLELTVCQGATGRDYPVLDIAEVNYNEFSEWNIRFNAWRRSRTP
jgi:hypothetical protein